MHSLAKAIIILLLAVSCTSKTQTEAESSSLTGNTNQKSFDYQPEAPVNGQLMGVIEIGSLGLNYFVISIDKKDRWELKKSDFGRSNLVFERNQDPEVIAKIKAFKNEIKKAGVSKQNIHIIASSSTVDLSNMVWLKNEVMKLDLNLIEVSAEQEAIYALAATIPSEFIKESFIVDIGSGNTKISWISAGDTTTVDTYGSKYYLDKVPDDEVFNNVRDILLKIPEKNRNLCFLIGGIPYEFAQQTNKRNGRYTILQSPSAYPSSEDRFNSGVVIYSALYLQPTYSYIFDWNANFSIGYLMTLN